jgi:hypothetical protein
VAKLDETIHRLRVVPWCTGIEERPHCTKANLQGALVEPQTVSGNIKIDIAPVKKMIG